MTNTTNDKLANEKRINQYARRQARIAIAHERINPAEAARIVAEAQVTCERMRMGWE